MARRDDVTIKFGADDSQVDKTLKSIRKSVNKLSTSFGTLEGAMTAFATGSGVRNLIELNAQFEELRAGVEFAGGDFEELTKLAGDNAVAIEEVAEAYTRLQNLRLDASRRSIEAYLNVAAGTPGKRLIDFTEAVADAVVGEFERLKEFGIRARKEGDEVALSFRGNTETITNDAKSIEEALIRIGEVEFAGAQAARANTLSGAISNLSSAFNQLFVSQEATEQTTKAIKDLTDTLTDPAVISGVNAFVSAIIKSVEGLTMIMGAVGSVSSDIRSMVGSMTDFAGLSQAELIEERNKLNEQQAQAIVNLDEINKKIEEGSFWLNGEKKLQEDIIDQTEQQITLISARLSLLKDEQQTEKETLDIKKKQTEEEKKLTQEQEKRKPKKSAGTSASISAATPTSPTRSKGRLLVDEERTARSRSQGLIYIQGQDEPITRFPGYSFQGDQEYIDRRYNSGRTWDLPPKPNPRATAQSLADFRSGRISATELGRQTGLQAEDLAEPVPGAFGTLSNTMRALPSAGQAGILVGPDPNYFTQQMRQILSGEDYIVRVRPVIVDDSKPLEQEVDRVGGRD